MSSPLKSNILQDTKDYDRVIDILNSEVDELQNEVSKLRATANRVEQQQFAKDVELDLPESDLLLQSRERRLKSELDVISGLDPVVEPVNENVCDLIIDNEFSQTWSNINHEISFMEKKKQELQVTIEKLNVNIERDRKITAAIDDKIQVLVTQLERRQEAGVEHNDDEELRVLNEKIKLTKIAVRDITQSMADFIDQFFSIPHKEYDEEDHPMDFLRLREIIQMVTEAYSENPNDPYVEITDEWWPAHVEILLRHDILVRHKTDPNKVRIEFYDG
ncbi:hypothetical protein CHUAL_014131 [Chamberlinius hualienensis]